MEQNQALNETELLVSLLTSDNQRLKKELDRVRENRRRQDEKLRDANPLFCVVCYHLSDTDPFCRYFSHKTEACVKRHCITCLNGRAPARTYLSHTTDECKSETRNQQEFQPCENCGAGIYTKNCNHAENECSKEKDYYKKQQTEKRGKGFSKSRDQH